MRVGWVVGLLALLLVPAGAQAPAPAADMVVSAAAEPSDCHEGDALTYHVQVTLHNDLTDKIEPWPPSLSGFDLEGSTQTNHAGQEPATTVYEWRYTLRARQAGDVSIGEFSLNYLDRHDGRRKQAKSNVVVVHVRAADAAADIHDAKPPVALPDYTAPWRWVALFLTVFLLTAGLLSLLARRPRRKAPATPAARPAPAAHVAAMAALAALENERLPERGELDRYHVELSRIVRHYLSGRYNVRASESTTSEIADQLLDRGVTPELVSLCRALLYGCDLEKFAAWEPGLPEMTALLERARTFVSRTAQREGPA